MADVDVQEPSTGVQEVSPEVETASETPEVPAPEAVPASEGEQQTETPSAESQTQVTDDTLTQLIDKHLGPAEPTEVEPDKVTLTRAQLDEQMRRERQSAADKARQEAQEVQAQREAAARQDYQMRHALRAQIDLLAKSALNEGTGELRPDFADQVAAQYEGMYFEKGKATAADTLNTAAFMALSQLEGANDANVDVSPLERPLKTPLDLFTGLFEVAASIGKAREAKAAEARIEKEVARRTRLNTDAIVRDYDAQRRQESPDTELPSGTAAQAKRYTEAEIAKMSPEQWENYRDTYYAEHGVRK
jgi:hypothetical protein